MSDDYFPILGITPHLTPAIELEGMSFGHLRLIFRFSSETDVRSSDPKPEERNTIEDLYAYIECLDVLPESYSGKMQLIIVEKSKDKENGGIHAAIVPLSTIRQTVHLVPHIDSLVDRPPPQPDTMHPHDYCKLLLERAIEAPLKAENVMERCDKFVVSEGLHLTNYLTVYTGSSKRKGVRLQGLGEKKKNGRQSNDTKGKSKEGDRLEGKTSKSRKAQKRM